MTRIFFTTVLLLVALVLKAQFPAFQWAKTIGGPSHDTGFFIATDADGNIYTTGYFEGIVDFEPGPAVYNLGTVNCHQAYIQKSDSSGQMIWTKALSGATVDDATGGFKLAVDPSGSVCIAGTFIGTNDFDPGIGIYNMTDGGMFDMFILKLDSAGNFVWAKQISGNSWLNAYSIIYDHQNNIYVSGDYSGIVDFDPGPNTSSQDAGARNDVFVLKLDSIGNFNWVKHIGGDSSFEGGRMSLDESGMIYAGGNFKGTGDFDPGVDSFKMTTFGSKDMFMIKLDTSGNFIWAKQFGGSLNEACSGVQNDRQSGLYITGIFEGVADMDPDTILSYNLTSVNNSDMVVLKLDTSGHFIWAKQIGGTSFQTPYSLKLDTFNNIYVSGIYQSANTDFDPGPAVCNLALNSNYDVFILKLNTHGIFRWAKHIEGSLGSGTQGNSITIDKNGSTYVTGVFSGLVDFNTDTSTLLINGSGGWDMYVHKMSQCPLFYDTITTSACDSFSLNGISYTSAGVYSQLLPGANGCDSVLILNLMISVIDTSVTQSGLTLTSNEPLANYQWINCMDGSPITGATSQTFVANANISCAVIVSKNNCVDTSFCYNISGVGLANYIPDDKIIITPNPSSGSFVVEFDTKNNGRPGLELKTIYGNTIIKKEMLSNRESINISNLPAGIYLLTIKDAESVYNQRIVKE